jgi:hypothetical protein
MRVAGRFPLIHPARGVPGDAPEHLIPRRALFLGDFGDGGPTPGRRQAIVLGDEPVGVP